MWPTRKNKKVEDWARRMESGEEDELSLELAALLSTYVPDVPPADEFKSELRSRLLAQSQRRTPFLLMNIGVYKGGLAVAALLGVIVFLSWVLVSNVIRVRPEMGQTSAGLVTNIEGKPLVVESPMVIEPNLGQIVYASDFTLFDARSGRELSLSDFDGQPVLLNFWATWCIPCRAEMPHIEKAFQEHGDQGLVVLAINFNESRDDVVAYGRELGLSFPLLLDPEGHVQQGDYAVYQYPTTIFVAPDGEIKVTHIGPLSEQSLGEKLAEIGS